MTGGPTPSQTVGPYIHMDDWPDIAGPDVAADDDPAAVWLFGRVVDGAGAVMDDAMIETWQADEAGRFASSDDPRATPEGFAGFGRCFTDAQGRWAVRTRKPGPVRGPGGTTQAPHVVVALFARGLLQRVVTRLYFPDEPEANAGDPILARLPVEEARTLIAAPGDGGYELDLRLQGDAATVFFDIR